MNSPAFTLSACLALSLPLASMNRIEAQEGGTFYPQGDPGLYRSVETEIDIKPNFRKESDSNPSAKPSKPKAPLIPPPPIPESSILETPVKETPKPETSAREATKSLIPKARVAPRLYPTEVPRLEPAPQPSPRPVPPVARPVPQVPHPDRRVELQDSPRIDIPSPPLNTAPPRSTYPEAEPYRAEVPDPRKNKRFSKPSFSTPRRTFPVPPQAFPELSRAFPTPPLPMPPSPHSAFPDPSLCEDHEANVAQLRETAHSLSRQGLKYKYGHFLPRLGGLDSSGSVQFLLTELGIPGVPRTIGGQLAWSKGHNLAYQFEFRPTVDDLNLLLEPGNMVFWGDFDTGRLSHVMVYLGYDSKIGKHFAFGTRGGTEVGLHGHEVDVFELKLDRERIVATGKIPGLSYR